MISSIIDFIVFFYFNDITSIFLENIYFVFKFIFFLIYFHIYNNVSKYIFLIYNYYVQCKYDQHSLVLHLKEFLIILFKKI